MRSWLLYRLEFSWKLVSRLVYDPSDFMVIYNRKLWVVDFIRKLCFWLLFYGHVLAGLRLFRKQIFWILSTWSISFPLYSKDASSRLVKYSYWDIYIYIYIILCVHVRRCKSVKRDAFSLEKRVFSVRVVRFVSRVSDMYALFRIWVVLCLVEHTFSSFFSFFPPFFLFRSFFFFFFLVGSRPTNERELI